MNRVGMDERLRQQPVAPLHSERLSQFFAGELETHGRRILIDELQVPELMEKHVIEHEPADGQRWPFMASSGSELFGRLASHEESRQAQTRRQSTQSDFPTSSVHISENARAAAPIVEVDTTETSPVFHGKTAQHDAHVFLSDIMDSISTGNR